MELNEGHRLNTFEFLKIERNNIQLILYFTMFKEIREYEDTISGLR